LEKNEALQRRASERPLVGCYAELGGGRSGVLLFELRREDVISRTKLFT
jgi:hypothetical protein